MLGLSAGTVCAGLHALQAHLVSHRLYTRYSLLRVALLQASPSAA